MVLGFVLFFFNKRVMKKEEQDENSTYTANAKNGEKIMVTWSLLPFAFHVISLT